MKVYEMIQELARYDADMEVEVNIYAKVILLLQLLKRPQRTGTRWK